MHRQNDTELWCNGNTTDSGPVILGSNPGSSTNPTDSRWGFRFYCSFVRVSMSQLLVVWCILLFFLSLHPIMLHYKTFQKQPEAPWVVMLHGAGGSSEVWYRQVGDFARHFNLLPLSAFNSPCSYMAVYTSMRRASSIGHSTPFVSPC